MHDENSSGSDAQRYSRIFQVSCEFCSVWPSWLKLGKKNKLLAPPIRRKRQKKWLVIWDHHPKQGVQNPKVNEYLRKMLKLQPNQPVNWWITESTKALAHAVRWCGQRAIEVGHFPLGPAARNVKRTYH